MALLYDKMTQKSKRILLFTTAFQPLIGGSEIAIESVARRLGDVFFDIITPKNRRSLKTVDSKNNICIHRIGFGYEFIDKYLFPILGALRALHLMRAKSYAAIHAYQASQGAGAAWIIKCLKPETKFILSLQEGKNLNAQSWWIKFFRNLIIKKADIVTGISNYLVNYARSINHRAETRLISNGVDSEKFMIVENANLALKKKLGIKESDRVVISVSRLVPKNGLANLIEAMSLVKEQIPDVKL